MTMINLLPVQEKRQLRKEYALRVGVYALGLVLILEVAAAVAFLPSYLEVRTRVISANEELAIRTEAARGEGGEAERMILEAEAAAKILATGEKTSVSEIVRAVLAAKDPALAISGISYERTGAISQVQVTGYAAERTALTAFQRKLKATGLFENVEFPSSAFTKERDIAFSMRMVLKAAPL